MKKVKLLSLIVTALFVFIINTKSLACLINDPNQTSQELKVLTIVIDPVLRTISDEELYGRSAHPRVSEWFGHDVNKSIGELKRDFEESSHGYIKVNIVKMEYLDEFPTYAFPLQLSNGTYSNRYDEETYINMSRSDYNSNIGDWYKMIESDMFKQVLNLGAGNFDYEYLINKFDLVSRRNKNEFDMVWMFLISPIGSNETMMVGRSAYWVNGEPIIKPCNNFVIAGLEIARTDSQFHSFGHMAENIMRNVFGQSKDIYQEGVYNINSKEDYNKLNLWERYTLTAFNNRGKYTSVGNTHFAFNGMQDYSYYDADRVVLSNYKEWENYGNRFDAPGDNFEKASNNNYIHDKINQPILASNEETHSEDRLWQRFWFSHLPYSAGYGYDGHLNNWWKYLYSLDYVESLSATNTNIEAYEGDSVGIDVILKYRSGSAEGISDTKGTKYFGSRNVYIQDNNILEVKDGVVYAAAQGTTKLTLYYDGLSIDYEITVKPKTLGVIITKFVSSIFSAASAPKSAKPKEETSIVDTTEVTTSEEPEITVDGDYDGICHDLGFLFTLAGYVIFSIKIIVPIILIISGMITLAQAVADGSDDKKKEAQKGLFKKAAYAVAVFLVIQIVSIVIGLVSSGRTYEKCAHCAFHPFDKTEKYRCGITKSDV